MSASPTQPTIGVLLAAGAGTRLGLGPKALLPFRDRTLVEELADVLLAGGCSEVIVVLGAEAEKVAALPGLARHRVLTNPQWAEGMSGSFRAGIMAASAGNNVMVALVDQPGLSSEIVARLLARHRPGRITAAAYPELSGTLRRGHPLVIDAELREEAAESAAGDAGARLFLKAHPGLVDLVDCGDLADGGDVDTKANLHLLG
ncbi:nicotine blue oxidoreductase [Arthrobacter cupressi]|uniref:Nicotine blue oxidoreductase n=1 Tax=Arthrobacter cupressi TaxID=1045773 RepID=A0A1G8K8X4_9MICC|nr:nucleotidyltransferase family protein [Arthrobacter cupressi]NYD77300.1 nicotine blue oxidoreductase [Arthrobacter cupressi]SDI39807.1 nicotine blue oxidoreductase [Arthrobacter cupressi]